MTVGSLTNDRKVSVLFTLRVKVTSPLLCKEREEAEMTSLSKISAKFQTNKKQIKTDFFQRMLTCPPCMPQA